MTVNTLGSDPRPEGASFASGPSNASRTVAEWLWPFLVAGLSLFSISALFYYHLHLGELAPQSLLQQVYAGIYDFVGLAPAVLFFLLVASWSTIWLVTGELHRPAARLLRLVVMAVLLGVTLNLGDGGVASGAHTGQLGAWIAARLVSGIGYWPSMLLVWPTMFASLMLATDWFFSEMFERARPASGSPETGVEDAVTDHLRGLSQAADGSASVPAPKPSTPKPSTTEPSTPEPSAQAPNSPVMAQSQVAERPSPRSEPAASGADPEPTVTDVPVTEEPSLRTLSYRERRRQRAERRLRQMPEVEEPAPDAGGDEAVDEIELASLFGEGEEVAGHLGQDGSGDDEPSDVEVDEVEAEIAEVEEYETDELDDEGVVEGEEYEAAEDDEDEYEVEDGGEADEYEYEDEDAEDDEDDEDDEDTEDAEDDDEAELAEVEHAVAADREARSALDEEDGEQAEVVVDIPRPDEPVDAPLPKPPVQPKAPVAVEPGDPRQQRLFGGGIDAELFDEAVELAESGRRITTALLQRKLRIDYELAKDLLAELHARGVVDGGAHG